MIWKQTAEAGHLLERVIPILKLLHLLLGGTLVSKYNFNFFNVVSGELNDSSKPYSFDILNYAASSGWIATDILVGNHNTTDGALVFDSATDYYYKITVDDIPSSLQFKSTQDSVSIVEK